MKQIRNVLPAAGCLAAAVTLAACGSSSSSSSSSSPSSTAGSSSAGSLIAKNPANAKTTITVGSKNFTEEYILGNIYAQALQAAGYTVKTQLNLGSEQIAFKALKQGTIDGYPEYTGTALTSFFNVAVASVPKSDQAAYQLARGDYAKQGITALAPSPFTDGQGVAITKAESTKLGGATTISAVASKPGLTFTGAPECRQRLDCLLGLQKAYSVKWAFKPVAPSLFYTSLDTGQAQVSEVFTTDGPLSTKKYVLLTDDKHLFPPDNVTFTVRKSVADKAGPDLAKVITQVQSGLTTSAMQELNARVDLQKQTPAAVATQYLKESGYIK